MRNPKIIAATAMSVAVLGGAVVGAAVGNPLASGAQDGTTTTTAPAGDTGSTDTGERDGRGGPGRDGFGFGNLEAAAEALGMTTDEVRAALDEGKTLATIAEEQGVERQDLIDALVAAGEERLDELKANLPDAVEKAIDATPRQGGDGFGRGGPGGRGLGLDAAAEALGLTTDELRDALVDGKTLADIADEQGVDQQVVIDALVAAAKERIAQAVTDGKLTQEDADERIADLTERITTQVTEGFPEGGPGRGGHPGDDQAPADDEAPADDGGN